MQEILSMSSSYQGPDEWSSTENRQESIRHIKYTELSSKSNTTTDLLQTWLQIVTDFITRYYWLVTNLITNCYWLDYKLLLTYYKLDYNLLLTSMIFVNTVHTFSNSELTKKTMSIKSKVITSLIVGREGCLVVLCPETTRHEVGVHYITSQFFYAQVQI